MYRLISFFVIFSFVSVMLYFHQQNGHDSASNHAEKHQRIVIPSSQSVPSITGSVTQDQSGTWLLTIKTNNFRFTPEKVGTDDIRYDEGHAHLYINGEKINRIYGNYYNVDSLEPGTHHIKVTLNGNNHGIFTHNGEEIAFNQTINIPKAN
jgi:hypothetical protein